MLDQPNIDTLWILFCASLVMLQQAGFLCLETGLTRKKNNINVAVKNITDACIAFLIFWIVGYNIAFSSNGLPLNIGALLLAPALTTSQEYAHFFYQAMFCCAAVTIISGSVAERISYKGYLIISILTALLIYPVFCNLAWSPNAWLAKLGFKDFAGSTVVHSVAGWIALAAVITLGPRLGRFDKDGTPKIIPPSNLVTASLGVLIIWFGWIGFNGGSTGNFSIGVLPVIINTFVGASGGFLTITIFNILNKNTVDLPLCLNGLLAGLVSVTAGADIMLGHEALIISVLAAFVMLGCNHLLLKAKIDDAIGVIPVHLAAGIWGTLSVPMLYHSDVQFLPQLIGVLICGAWCFGFSFLAMRVLKPYVNWRVDQDSENIGLNISEHGANDDLAELLKDISSDPLHKSNKKRLPVEPFTEIGRLADEFNQLLDSNDIATAELFSEKEKNKISLQNMERLNNSISGHMAVSTTDLNGRITFVNDRFCELSQYTSEELLCSSHRIIKSDKHDDFFWQNVWKALGTGDNWSGRICNRAKDGSLYWVEATISPSYNDSRITGYLSIQINATTNKNHHSENDHTVEPALDSIPSNTAVIIANTENTQEKQRDIKPAEDMEPALAPIEESKLEPTAESTSEKASAEPSVTTPEEVPYTLEKATRTLDQIQSKNDAIPYQNLASKRCLLVEDIPDNQMLAKMLLDDIGIAYSVANNGQEALDALETDHFDIILMDCQMPGMDGYEATEQIRAGNAGAKFCKTPIIAMTANAMKGDKTKCVQAGMTDYLSKPIDSDILEDKIRYWLLPDNAVHKQGPPRQL